MFKSLLKVALRNMRKKWLFTTINIVGLTVGIACFFLIVVNVRDEFSYDKFIPDGNRIYRVALERIYPTNRIFYAVIPFSIGDAIVSDVPEVERMTRVLGGGGNNAVVLQYQDKAFEEKKFLFVEPGFFRFFSIPFVQGNPDSAFSTPNSLVLTRTTARKYFGNENPIGKFLTTPQGPFLVSGVCEDLPKNSHLEFDLVANQEITGLKNQPNYISFSVHTYVRLPKGVSPKAVEARMPALVEKYAAGPIQAQTGQSFQAYTAAGNGYHYFLQPVRSIHLHSNLEMEIRSNGNISYVYVLMAIAAFLIVIACINFMNLATARSTARAREVGIRKIAGTTRRSLISQFLFESLLTSLISVIAAVVLARFLLPVFNQLLRKELGLHLLRDPFQLGLLAAIWIVVGILAGLYPAFVLSSFQPIAVLKGRFTTSKRGVRMRDALVVLQFVISIVCIAMTILVYRQLEFMRAKDLGFQPANVVVVDQVFALRDRGPTFRQEVERLPGVVSASGSNTLVSGGFYAGEMFQTETDPEVKTTRGTVIDEDFIGTLGLTVVQGRGFSREFNEARNVLINEKAMRELGWPNPVGMKIKRLGGQDEARGDYTIVGVVKDLHYNSLRSPVNSFIYFGYDRTGRVFGTLHVRIKPENARATVAAIENLWKSFGVKESFQSDFLQDRLDAMYGNEKTSGRVFTLFSILAILIACVGLFGLSSYVAEMRTKEIGIRKILGSTPSKIVVLLSREFALLVLLALLIALPIAYYAMSRWLQTFAFRTTVAFWIFLAAGAAALAIEQATISFQALKAARTNPADALRFE
jgi:putative ABC transport system permease protein